MGVVYPRSNVIAAVQNLNSLPMALPYISPDAPFFPSAKTGLLRMPCPGIGRSSRKWNSRVTVLLVLLHDTQATHTPSPSPPNSIVTSTSTTSPEPSARDSGILTGEVLPRKACALAQRVPRHHTYVVIPRDPPFVVMACVLPPDFGAVGIYADTVGPADVSIPVTRLDGPIGEVGGMAVSASVSRGIVAIRVLSPQSR